MFIGKMTEAVEIQGSLERAGGNVVLLPEIRLGVVAGLGPRKLASVYGAQWGASVPRKHRNT